MPASPSEARELRLPALPSRIEIPMEKVVTAKNVEEYLKQ
jgi:hypothetical protein